MLTSLIQAESKLPYYEQIYRRIRDLIRSGELASGTKLPSGRNLSQELQVSRNTVSLAYDQLAAEGYIEAVSKSGYYVNKLNDSFFRSDKIPDNLNSEKESQLSSIMQYKEEKKYRYDFSPFSIDITSFPYSTWRKLYSKALNDLNEAILLRGDNRGDENLRKEVADYLRNSRGVHCTDEQILIGAGNDYLLQLLCQIFDTKKDCFAMENPTYPKAYRIISGFGFQVSPIAVLRDGLDTGKLYSSDANLVYVTPSHQYPLGVILSAAKRGELLEWASGEENRYIIEDDHDSEFRYKGKPIPSLQGSDYSDSVIYMGTFSRSIAPGMRVGYLVLPKKLLKKHGERLYLYSSTVSRTEQAVLTSFLREGYFERHLNRMRKQYKSRHDCMLTELQQFGNQITIGGENAGLHLVVTFHNKSVTRERIQKIAEELNMCLRTIDAHYITDDGTSEVTILLGFACIDETGIQEGLRLLNKKIN